MNLGVDRIKKYGIESIVIFLSIIVSFYIEDQRDLAQKKSDKNKLITEEAKRLAKLEAIAEKLKRGENVQNRQLQTWLSEEEYE